ncbi:dephospho-CoA kinase [Thiohalobacter sp. IOR34]|uniref:dephospho-CoA kinase n=1 Tax=Thiohalobacter sp. IOR34 TaxID=3057176 RepID=UPI0025B0CAB9|nr:dephospho-CoA kinase [Thiohalobacter sp. IOR34]WJW74936.1 dephospho-CoA kinase [Thiohalobacter sp. IOR34]
MLIIGLTGGIGSGKSTAAEQFASLGIPVIDADEIAHRLVEPGNPALDEIAATFGDRFLTGDGRLDRARLRQAVFADPAQRRRLEAILHPRIRRAMLEAARSLDAPYCLFVIPLLIESGWRDLVDRVLVIDCPETLQRQRVRERGLDEAQIDAILAAQASREQRLAAADDIIRNDGDLQQLKEQVGALHRKYLELVSPDIAPRRPA